VNSPMIRTIVALSLMSAAATAGAAPPSPVFSYQGALSDGGNPADGPYDLRFRLFDSAAGGTELGLVGLDDHSVVDGLLTAELDFGDPFDGRSLWLEIEVRDGASAGVYTTLSPRQPLTTAPHALFAADAGHAVLADGATTAGDTDILDGRHGAFYLEWSNLTDVPAGLDDGDDDVIGDLSCAPGEVVTWNGSAWICDIDDGTGHARTKVVSADSDALANGAALLAAVDSIPEPASREDAWRIKLEPGHFDLDGATLVMKPWTVLEGAGQGITLVSSDHCASVAGARAVIDGASDSEIRDLTVENTCTTTVDGAIAVHFDTPTDRGRLTRITARASVTSGGCSAIVMRGDGMVLDRVTAFAMDCPGESSAIVLSGSGGLALDCVAEASGSGDGSNLALSISGPTRVIGGSFTAGDSVGWGDDALRIEANTEIADVTARCVDTAVAVRVDSSLVVTLSRLDLYGMIRTFTGSGDPLALVIEHSRIHATPTTVLGSGNTTIGIAASRLDGGPAVTLGGTMTCAGVWDEDWSFYPNTCP